MFKAKDVMQRNLITVSRDTDISEAIKILAENKITGLPVVEDDMTLIGLVSEKDVLSIAYRTMAGICDAVMNNKKIGDVMTTNVTSFRPDDNLADICQCFLDKSFRRVPVVQEGRLVGLISRKDIITHAFAEDVIKDS